MAAGDKGLGVAMLVAASNSEFVVVGGKGVVFGKSFRVEGRVVPWSMSLQSPLARQMRAGELGRTGRTWPRLEEPQAGRCGRGQPRAGELRLDTAGTVIGTGTGGAGHELKGRQLGRLGGTG